MQAQTSRSYQITQHPPVPNNLQSHSKYLPPREPHLSRTNSNSKSFKKISEEKSTKQQQIQHKIKYAVNPYKTQNSFQKSFINSEKNLGLALTNGPFQETTTSLNQTKTWSKSRKGSDRQQRKAEKIDLTKPFDILSEASAFKQHKNKDRNDEYYLYWKGKAHQYLESNMKLMEINRKLTRQNQQFKQRIQNLQSQTNSFIKVERNNSEIVKTSIKKEQSQENNYLLQKMEEMQRELKKKQIVIKAYQQKIVEFNTRIVGDNQRIRLISKLKSEIDILRSQLNVIQTPNKRTDVSTQDITLQGKYKTYSRREQPKSNNLRRS